jgi:hypothetical protein
MPGLPRCHDSQSCQPDDFLGGSRLSITGHDQFLMKLDETSTVMKRNVDTPESVPQRLKRLSGRMIDGDCVGSEKDSRRETPLHLEAARDGDREVVGLLVE